MALSRGRFILHHNAGHALFVGAWTHGSSLRQPNSRRRDAMISVMSPTVFRREGFRFYFFSREERRMHVHVYRPEGEAKFWVEPKIELAQNYGLTKRQLNVARRLIVEHEDEIRSAWKEHFKS